MTGIFCYKEKGGYINCNYCMLSKYMVFLQVFVEKKQGRDKCTGKVVINVIIGR